MRFKQHYVSECNLILNIISQLSGREKYLYAHALQGAIEAASGVATAGEDVRYANDFQRILQEATDIVVEYEKDNLGLRPPQKSDSED